MSKITVDKAELRQVGDNVWMAPQGPNDKVAILVVRIDGAGKTKPYVNKAGNKGVIYAQAGESQYRGTPIIVKGEEDKPQTGELSVSVKVKPSTRYIPGQETQDLSFLD